MLWSPVVKDSQGLALYNQVGHLAEVKANIKAKYGVELECVVNDVFLSCLDEMRKFSALETAELQCPLMRLLQIEAYLGKHVAKVAANKRLKPADSLLLCSDEKAT
jgi:hypothetical protein